MAYKKDMYDPNVLANSIKQRFPLVTEKAMKFMEANIDNVDDYRARDSALKLYTKMFDKFVPDPPKPKGEGSGEISETFAKLLDMHSQSKKKVDLDNAIEAEVVDVEDEKEEVILKEVLKCQNKDCGNITDSKIKVDFFKKTDTPIKCMSCGSLMKVGFYG